MQRWKVLSGMLLLVLFGFLCGAVATNLWRDYGKSGRGPRGPMGALLAPDVAEKLELDPDQKKTFDGVVEDVRAQFLVIRQEFRPRADGILGVAFQRLEAVLRPEQKARLQKLREENPWREPSPLPSPTQ